MPMALVSTGQVIAANDHNSIVNALKGTAGENLTVFTKGVDLASASALILGTDGNYWHVVGTATVTSISSLPAGTVIKLEFDSALTLTHNGTSLILQGAANVTTSGGDVFEFTSEGSGNWRETGRGWAATAITLRGTPSLTFSTTNNQGSGSAFLSRNATIALFDTTAARAVAFGDVGTTGGVNFASPRDHGHAFALGATIIASTNNVLTVGSTNGTLTWSPVTAAAETLGALVGLGSASVFTLNGTNFTPIVWTAVYNPLSFHSVASATIWKPSVAGSYLINASSGYLGNVNADSLVIFSVLKNQTTRYDIDRHETRSSGVSNAPVFHGAFLLPSMNGSTDFFEITHYTSGAANDTITGNLSIVRVA